MSRLRDGVKPMTTGTLIERTEKIISYYDAETKNYAFSDSGDAEGYANEMADLLEQWAKAGLASRTMHPSSQRYSEDVVPPRIPSIQDYAEQRWRDRNKT
jgi:hypothetical protein